MRTGLLFLLVMGLMVYPLGRLYYRLTDGFSLNNIYEPFVWHPNWDVVSCVEGGEVEKALSQEYFYLGKGCQSYVFASADGKYVLKFFKYQRYRPVRWLSLFPKQWQKKMLHKQEKRECFCQSWKLAAQKLSASCALLDVHLNLSEEGMPVVIHDKMGRRYEIDLARHQYLVQRKGIPLWEAIQVWEEGGEKERSKALLNDLFSLFWEEYREGIHDNDPNIIDNMGVWEGRLIHLDVGQFRCQRDRKEEVLYKQDFTNKMDNLYSWLEHRYPDLATWVDERREEILGEEGKRFTPERERCY